VLMVVVLVTMGMSHRRHLAKNSPKLAYGSFRFNFGEVFLLSSRGKRKSGGSP